MHTKDQPLWCGAHENIFANVQRALCRVISETKEMEVIAGSEPLILIPLTETSYFHVFIQLNETE